MVKIYNDATTTYSQAGQLYSVGRIIYNDPAVTYSSSIYTYGGFTEGVVTTRTLSDSEGITDNLSYWISITTYVNLSDTEGIADMADYVSAVSRIVADNVGVTDNVNREICWGRTVTDAEGLTDNLTRAFQIYVSLSDSEAITDNIGLFIPLVEKAIINMLENRTIKPQMEPYTVSIKLKSTTTVKPQMLNA